MLHTVGDMGSLMDLSPLNDSDSTEMIDPRSDSGISFQGTEVTLCCAQLYHLWQSVSKILVITVGDKSRFPRKHWYICITSN